MSCSCMSQGFSLSIDPCVIRYVSPSLLAIDHQKGWLQLPIIFSNPQQQKPMPEYYWFHYSFTSFTSLEIPFLLVLMVLRKMIYFSSKWVDKGMLTSKYQC